MFVNVLDPDLSFLASNGESTELDAVRELGERLRNSLDKPSPDQPARGLQVDTETQAVLGQAFTATGADPARILSDLWRRTEEIAEQLSSAESAANQSELEAYRAFCVALSQSATAHRQLVFDVRPPHPYRR